MSEVTDHQPEPEVDDLVEERPWVHPVMIAAWVVFGVSCVIGLLAAYVGGVRIKELVRDPSAQFDIPLYAGAFSTVGLIVLGAAAALFAIAIKGAPRQYRVLLWTGSILMILMILDDGAMLHEYIGPDILGIGELFFYGLYAALGLLIYWEVKRLAKPRFIAAAHVAGGFLLFSLLLDIFSVHGPFSFWLEDFTKLSGYVGFLGLAVYSARAAMGVTED
ncbi:MAG: hypothetical protein AAGA47_03600 [Pseudomonadota bacterium]